MTGNWSLSDFRTLPIEPFSETPQTRHRNFFPVKMGSHRDQGLAFELVVEGFMVQELQDTVGDEPILWTL